MSYEGVSTQTVFAPRFSPSELPSEYEPGRWFRTQLEPHLKSLKGYLMRSYPFVPDLDDVIQESVMKVLVVAETKSLQNPRAFLFRVARNRAIDAGRRLGASPYIDVTFEQAAQVADPARTAVDQLEESIAVQIVQRALALLPPRQALMLRLRRIEGLSYREIALQTGVKEATVDQQCYQGMKRLTAMIRRQLGSRKDRADESSA